jgi:signal transduction histidine kinase
MARSYYRNRLPLFTLAVGALVLVASLFLLPHTASATNYGSQTYNNTCGYDSNCPSPAPAISPQVMPDGLKVIINLANGQTIPADGFTLTITQLTSTSTITFKSAVISIEGTVAQTVTPDATGTATWKWDPQSTPGTHIDIVVTASDGSTSTYDYTVVMGPASTSKPSVDNSSNNYPGSGAGSNGGGGTSNAATDPNVPAGPIGALLSTVVPEGVKQVFRSIPAVAINTFPYVLFIALGAVVAILLLQIRRELIASGKIAGAIEQEELMLELKKNFIGLASHYLRTPVTLIAGSIDLYNSSRTMATEPLNKLKSASDQLAEHVKDIIASEEKPVILPEPPQQTNNRIRIGLAIAIIVVAVIFALFNLLAYASGRGAAALNVLTQFVVLVFIGLALYQVDRRFALRKLERKAQDNVLALQQHLQEGQDSFLQSVATQLYEDHKALAQLIAPIPIDSNTRTLREGVNRLADVVSKCRTAQSLKGSYSMQQPVMTDVKNIFDYSDPQLTQRIADKKLTISAPSDKQFGIQEPFLINYVTRSLIDNAVAYSPENSTITLNAIGAGSKLNLAISDKGKGISNDRKQMLFQPLSKVEGYETFDHEGMGFSLYLDKLIMRYLGGDIELQSQENQGTTVNLQLPVA